MLTRTPGCARWNATTTSGKRYVAGTPDATIDQRTGDSLTELADAPGGLREKRLRAEHVIGEELPGGSQLAAPGSALDQLHPGLPLHVRDVLGDGGLTDAELPRRRRERAAPREGRERPQARLELHNQRLYRCGLVCISVLSAAT